MVLTVPDPDAMFARATRAGARVVVPVKEVDPFGHHWEIGRPLQT